MFKKASLKQKGFTLIELLVAMAIAAVLLTAIVTIFRTSIHMNSNIDNQTNATNQLKNAFNYIDRDAEEAGSVVPTNTNQFPLTLKWIQNNIDETIIYNISNSGILQRYQYQSGALQSTMNVANYVNTNAAQTNCTWDNTNDVLTINMTVSIGTINTSRQFIITPRVVQGAISLATSITTMSATPNPSGFGQLVTFTANVTGSSGTPTGIITFFDNGTTQFGSGNLSGGQASYSTSSLSQGSHSITAVYSGDALYNQSTSLVWTLTVIYVAPTVTVISPNSGPVAGGTSVTITGTNFVTGATVTIGGNTATGVSVTNSTTITATTPAGTAGTVNVIVTTAGGSSNAFSGYTYNNPAPTLSNISPTTGNRLQTLNVTFTGTNFISGVSSVNVGTGITVNSTTVNSSTQIVASITIGATAATGSNSFSVTNGTPGGGTSATETFTVSNPAPTLTSISPTSGTHRTTMNVTLTGTNFISGVSSVTGSSGITINSTTVNSSTQITVNITISSSTGTRTFKVTNNTPGGGTSGTQNFTVN